MGFDEKVEAALSGLGRAVADALRKELAAELLRVVLTSASTHKVARRVVRKPRKKPVSKPKAKPVARAKTRRRRLIQKQTLMRRQTATKDRSATKDHHATKDQPLTGIGARVANIITRTLDQTHLPVGVVHEALRRAETRPEPVPEPTEPPEEPEAESEPELESDPEPDEELDLETVAPAPATKASPKAKRSKFKIDPTKIPRCPCCERSRHPNSERCYSCEFCRFVDGKWESVGLCPKITAGKLRPVDVKQVETDIQNRRKSFVPTDDPKAKKFRPEYSPF